MVKLKVIESRRALYNISEIVNYYEDQQNKLGSKFLRCYDSQIDKLREMPNIGRIGKVFGTQKLMLQEFPYIAVYRVRKSVIQILSVFHQYRKYPI